MPRDDHHSFLFNPFLHPFLFVLAFLFYVYSRSHVIVSPGQLIRPVLIYSFLLAVFFKLVVWLIHDLNLTGLLSTVIVLGFFASFNFFIFILMVLVPVFFLWVVYSRLRRIQMITRQVNLLLNAIGFILVLAFSVPLISALSATSKTVRLLENNEIYTQSIDIRSTSKVRPDIYYIVLDGYTRADILQELYGYDNFVFLRSLKKKGFLIPEKSRSNYPKTALSVSSSLNMDYIDAIAPGLQDSFYWWLMSPLIDHSLVRKTLEQLGYRSVSIMTDWSITDNSTTDIYYRPKPIVLNDLENVLLHISPFGATMDPLLTRFAFVQSNETHHELGLYQFKKLAEIPLLPGPKFIFVHIIAPHPPFVTTGDGNFRTTGYSFNFNDASDFPLGAEDYRKGYIGQVEFINGQVESLVDVILKVSEVPPIIIFQADHGSGLLTDFRSPTSTCLKERFSTFAAYYLPGVDKSAVPDDITPVNLFRVIFNEYFDTDLPLLDRKHYFSNGITKIYNETDVTSQVDTCSPN